MKKSTDKQKYTDKLTARFAAEACQKPANVTGSRQSSRLNLDVSVSGSLTHLVLVCGWALQLEDVDNGNAKHSNGDGPYGAEKPKYLQQTIGSTNQLRQPASKFAGHCSTMLWQQS